MRWVEDEGEERHRFFTELEFVCALSNPRYAHHLAQHGYFRDPRFVRYLCYLQYWGRPEYVGWVAYPHAIHFLGQLQDPWFREALGSAETADFLFNQQFYMWMYGRPRPAEVDKGKDEGGEGQKAGGKGSRGGHRVKADGGGG